MVLSRTPPKSVSHTSTAIMRYKFSFFLFRRGDEDVNLSNSDIIFCIFEQLYEGKQIIFMDLIFICLILFYFSEFCGFLFFLSIGFRCCHSQIYKPRRVPPQRKTPQKYVVFYFISQIHFSCIFIFWVAEFWGGICESFIFFVFGCRNPGCHIGNSSQSRCCLLHSCAFQKISQDS